MLLNTFGSPFNSKCKELFKDGLTNSSSSSLHYQTLLINDSYALFYDGVKKALPSFAHLRTAWQIIYVHVQGCVKRVSLSRRGRHADIDKS